MFFRLGLYIIAIFSSLMLNAQNPEAIKQYNAALEYFNLRNYEAAIPLLKDAIKTDERFYYAYRTLISCYEQLGRLDDAIVYYEKATMIAPSDKALVYNLALTYLQKKDYDRTKIWLQKALSIDPTYAKAAQTLKEVEDFLNKKNRSTEIVHVGNEEVFDANNNVNKIYNEALVLYREGKFKESIVVLLSYEEEISNPNFYYLMAITYQQLGKRAEAIEAYENTIELDDRHFDANLNLATIYYNDQKYKESVPLFETAYGRRKNDRKLLYSLAKALYFSEKYAESIPYLEKYLSYNVTDAEAYYHLSVAFTKTGDSKKSAKAFEMAKMYGGTGNLADELEASLSKYGKLASEHTKNGNYSKAIEVLEEAITKHSEAASLHFNLGLNYLEVGNVKKAQEEFAKTIELDPNHAKAYQGLGMIYYDRADYPKAAAYYLATIEAGKFDEFVYYKLASCYFHMNRYYEAIQAFEKAIELNPREKQFHFSLGLSYLQNKENLKSIRAFEAALSLDNNFLDAQYHICINHIEMNDFDKAIEEAQKIIKKNDQYAKAYLVMAHAYKRIGRYDLADQYKAVAVRLDPSLKD